MTPTKPGPGLTASEQLLAEISQETFLRLWSWPNVFGEPGKELCDLLVVCGDDVIIFSDKSIAWSNAEIEVAWPRWYKRAIEKSADQIRGAVRWMDRNPTELFVDAKCTSRLPIQLPPLERRRVYGVCVALGAEAAAAKYFNDVDGTMMIVPHLKGKDHVDFSVPGHRAFCVGDVDPTGPFVHVFNQSALQLTMKDLNTISDFTDYLKSREALIRSGQLAASPSEMEMVGHYLQTMKGGKHGFPEPADFDKSGRYKSLLFAQGDYAAFQTSDKARKKRALEAESLIWDELINRFSDNVLGNGGYAIEIFETDNVAVAQGLLIMAREPRLARRALVGALKEIAQKFATVPENRAARIVLPQDSPTHNLAYVFLILSEDGFSSHKQYREARSLNLLTYCQAVLYDSSELTTCVGLAFNAPSDTGESEDLLYLDRSELTRIDDTEFKKRREELSVLSKSFDIPKRFATEHEFPADPSVIGLSRQQRRAAARAARKTDGSKK